MLTRSIDRLKDYLSPPAAPVFGLVLGGGGARGAYQAGVLSYLSEAFPDVSFPVMTGVSAGAINAAGLANHTGTLRGSVDRLLDCWRALTTDDVYIYRDASRLSLMWDFVARTNPFANDEPGGVRLLKGKRALVDTSPLRAYLDQALGTEDGELTGIRENLARGTLQAVALITTSYATGQTVTWVEGADVTAWERPNRVCHRTVLTTDHILASTALPLLFPAVQIGDAWYGDGGVRLAAPLSPAIHLGADRLLVVSTRYNRSRREADEPAVTGYPPLAQVLGILMNAIFLDALEEDAVILERINRLVEHLPHRHRKGLRPIRHLILRPSMDLGMLAADYEMRLPEPFPLLTRGMGTDQTKNPDWLSMLLFQEAYINRLVDLGYDDTRRQHDQLAAFFAA